VRGNISDNGSINIAEIDSHFGDGYDDFHIPTTTWIVLNIDIEHPLEQARPTDAHKSRGMRQTSIENQAMQIEAEINGRTEALDDLQYQWEQMRMGSGWLRAHQQ